MDRRQQVLAIPEQLRIGVQRYRVQGSLVLGRLRRDRKHALKRLLALRPGDRLEPPGGRELRRPDRVHVQQRVVGVVRRQALHRQLARGVRAVRLGSDRDRVTAAGLLAARRCGLDVRPVRVDRAVVDDRHRSVRGARRATSRDPECTQAPDSDRGSNPQNPTSRRVRRRLAHKILSSARSGPGRVSAPCSTAGKICEQRRSAMPDGCPERRSARLLQDLIDSI